MGRNLTVYKRQAPKRSRPRRKLARKHKAIVQLNHSTKCKHCGCTEMNCSQCIEAQGFACWWVSLNVCSRCSAEGKS